MSLTVGTSGPLSLLNRINVFLAEAQLIDFFDQRTDDEIHLENEITMLPGLRRSLKRPTGEGRQMNGLSGVKQEERFVG